MSQVTPLFPNVPIQQFAPSSDNSPADRTARNRRGVADSSKRWSPGVITVSLDLANKKSQALVIDALKEWAHHTPGLQFEIVEGKRGDIRVSDDEGFTGSWSVIGTDALLVDEDQPTLHLDRTDNSKQLRTHALHEFGHALGLLHEHQHPQSTLDWDEQAVRDYFVSERFPAELVQEQILDPLTGPDVQSTAYDPQSVMHYPFPAHLSRKGHGTSENFFLSPGDQEAIRRLYRPNIPGVS